jgi:hypothetical protein
VAERELKTGWDEFLHWVERFVSEPSFDADERDYKVKAVEPLREAISRLDGGWYDALRRGFQNQNNNIVDWRASQSFLSWADENRSSAAEALKLLWSDDASQGAERIDAFNEFIPLEVLSRPGVFCNLAAYLLGAKDPRRWPNFKVTALNLAYELARFPGIPRRSSPGRHYGHALSFFDAMIHEARARGITLRDRLDAQGAMWVIAGGGEREPYDLSLKERSEFDEFVEVPSKVRKERAIKAKPESLQKKKPTTRVCPQCGYDDEVRLVGPSRDRWEFECQGGGHPGPFRFFGS